jgi:RHS repeat-associated protein
VVASNLNAASCPTAYSAAYSPATSRLAADATSYAFDSDGNQTAMYTPAPAGQTGYETTSYAYDSDANLTMTTAPPVSNGGVDRVTTDTYNSDDQLVSETNGSGTSAASTTTYCYDLDGDTTAVVMPDGNTSGTAACETSSPWVVSASAHPTQAAYQTTSSYDSAGELVSTAGPATAAAPGGATTTETYDPAGNTLTRTDPDKITTTWMYTPLNQPAAVSYSGGSAHSVTYGYDASGNRTSMADASGGSSAIYDSFGELTSSKNGAGQTVGYGYNADGAVDAITYPLPASATWPTTDTVNLTLDKAGLLTQVSDFNGNLINIGNTADGQPDSVGLGSSGDTIATTYDSTDMPSAIMLKKGGTLQSFTYSDSPAGTILPEADAPSSPSSPAAYTYDAQERVTSMTPGSASTRNYAFDASSNLTALPSGGTGTYDKAEELTSATQSGDTTSYAYNADGERLTATQGGNMVSSGTWNGAGQLTAYTSSSASMTAATYNGNGQRVSATTGSGTQQFVWDTATNVPQVLMDSRYAYIYCGGQAPAEQVNLVTGAVTYLVADSLGSVRGTVTAAGGLTGTTSYDTWGNPDTSGGLTSATPFGYAGGYTDPTGLVYLINRYYDPVTGQFISVDPAVAQTLQPYVYAGDNPVSDTDPSGLEKGVKYKKQCLDVGCVNVSKKCDDSLKHCMLYWNTEFIGIYKAAIGADLVFSLHVNGTTVYGPRPYGHPKNGAQKPLFHGSWGFKRDQPNQWGKYTYLCLPFYHCTRYMNANDGVSVQGKGTFDLGGSIDEFFIDAQWGKGKGEVVEWKGSLRWAGLPS